MVKACFTYAPQQLGRFWMVLPRNQSFICWVRIKTVRIHSLYQINATMKSLRTVIVLFLLVLFNGSCDSSGEKVSIRIEGRVMDYTNNAPIAVAEVRLDILKGGDAFNLVRTTLRTKTDEEGRYTLEGSHSGSCFASMFAERMVGSLGREPGYHKERYTAISQTHAECTDKLQTINFRLCPLSCEFTVCRPTCFELSTCTCD